MRKGSIGLLVLLASCNFAARQRKQCENGDAQLCMDVAKRRLIGKGIEIKLEDESLVLLFKDPAKIPLDEELVWYFEQGCRHGNLEGCAIAGGAYEGGNGVGRDVARGAQLLERACKGGFEAACAGLRVR